ncbi:MAG: RluA family pseudouridine synthase [Termitinemataceae bacterium]
MKNIDILYADDDCVVLNKKAGLPVQGGVGISISLDDLLEREWNTRPFLVHRLDKDTSGLILVAKHKVAAQYYSAQIAGKGAHKIYLAACFNIVTPAHGVIELPLEVRGMIKKAFTKYRVLGTSDRFSLAELELGSGRMHQIRRHLAMIGNPIVGDDKYGDFSLNKLLKKERGIKHLLLHSWQLRFINCNKQPISVTAPLPDYFVKLLQQDFPQFLLP